MEEISNKFDNLRVPVSANDREKGTTPYYGANGIQDYVKGFTHNGEYVLIAEDGANDLKNYPVKYVNGLFWANNHVHVVQGKEGICDNKYLKYCFTKTNIESLLVGGGRAKLNANIMMSIDLTVPSFNEQVELGRMFYELDNLITLHQRKYNCFSNSWEQRKLGEIINETIDNRGKNPPYYCESGIPIIDNFMIKNNGYPDLKIATRYLDDYLFSNFIRKYNEKDDVLITLVGNGIGNIALFPKEKSAIVQNTIGMRFEHPKKFKYYSLLSKNNEIVKLDRGMAQPSIRQDELKNLDINLPTEKEQSKIESLMTNLDNLITLHQHKELKRRKDKNEHLRW